MHRTWIIPLLMIVFGLLSVVGLRSVAPTLAATQLGFFVAAGVVMTMSVRPRFEQWLQLAPWLYLGLVAMLVLTLLLADATRGSVRWIEVAGVNIQASQLAIPVVSLMMLWWSRQGRTTLTQFLGLLAIMLGPAGLIFIQPDLGTTLVLLATTGVIVWLATPEWRYLGLLGSSAVVVGVVAWFFLLQPYQKNRIFAFIGYAPESSLTINYNAQQALIAVGSGQLFGRGLGQGIQSHLRFLPERQTDFIFASLAEELGLAGGLLILALYTSLTMSMMYIAEQASTPQAQWYIYVIAMMTVLQAGINIGMNIGLVPITGVTLPLLSYGGSSVLSLALCYSIVVGISQRQSRKAKLEIG